MKRFAIFLALLIPLIFACNTTPTAEKTITDISEVPFLTPDILCGTVQFSDGCGTEMDSLISFGLALVHHMTYDDAEHIFDQVIKSDPDCFWGHWGKALTYIHPLWPDEPSESQMQRGWILTQKAMQLASEEREELFGKALAAYYEDGASKSEKERLMSYMEGWNMAKEARPDDVEARLFHGLTRLANVSPDDKTHEVQIEVGKMAEAVLEEIDNHPGGFHYAIHAYDLPPLAHHAVRVARNYGKIAPEIPHALHMPTHIFTRLGYWQESIDWNYRSARAAEKMEVNGQISLHYMHALDYMVYAHLQQGEDQTAKAILDEMNGLTGPIQPHAASAYALASLPVRYALERKNWQEAAQISIRTPGTYPWDNFPAFEAITHFGRGLGAARSGDLEVTKTSIASLDSLQKKMVDSRSTWYWRQQIEIQKLAVEAWAAFAEGDLQTAEEKMMASVEIEDALDKSPITPGEILPANEMMGDLMIEMKKPKEALVYYEKSLKGTPNRLNSYYGAMMAARELKDDETMKKYAAACMEVTSGKKISDRVSAMQAEMKKVSL
jgi:tetratricopeptide (TPR) repeat protein